MIFIKLVSVVNGTISWRVCISDQWVKFLSMTVKQKDLLKYMRKEE